MEIKDDICAKASEVVMIYANLEIEKDTPMVCVVDADQDYKTLGWITTRADAELFVRAKQREAMRAMATRRR